ncbi:dihydrofolate reductase [Phyllobacterium sp. 0TCS1.6C]|uniref:dihydrofolate reductase n=1 Tax=unclassified Phyllobacterium TaxID=2638441 RepID=UPI00226539CF|nr:MULTISPECIES: dihydrofolate reductase [unclassified Phyllobacterium]MCX8279560.1 dihydrofolate reductase [Phyllobacterium sp. 0TCS1.6C]MCX8292249.1 dihydrofolate reductase [Phyllobacterium sp. 0TCS1.6A]
MISFVVAIAQNGVIGRENDLPWRLSTDLKRFKATTMGKPIIMGRKTWESLGRPLPGRTNIVVTRDTGFAVEGVIAVRSIDEALLVAGSHAAADRVDEICIIGGGEIFRQALNRADRLHVTWVLADIEGDVHFPPIDPAVWEEKSSEEFPSGEKDSHPTRHVVYDRRR